MKKDIMHQGRLYEYQRSNLYQIHLDRINKINKKTIQKPKQIKSNKSEFLPTYPSGYKIQQSYQRELQNQRLIKKLSQINNRKRFEILPSSSSLSNTIQPINQSYDKYIELHKKSKMIERINREKQLQEENQKFVDNLLERLKKRKGEVQALKSQSHLQNILLRKSQSKKKLRKSRDKTEKYSIKQGENPQGKSIIYEDDEIAINKSKSKNKLKLSDLRDYNENSQINRKQQSLKILLKFSSKNDNINKKQKKLQKNRKYRNKSSFLPEIYKIYEGNVDNVLKKQQKQISLQKLLKQSPKNKQKQQKKISSHEKKLKQNQPLDNDNDIKAIVANLQQIQQQKKRQKQELQMFERQYMQEYRPNPEQTKNQNKLTITQTEQAK